MNANNPFFRTFLSLLKSRTPVSPPPRATTARVASFVPRPNVPARRHEVALGGFGKRAFPISLWASPHDPLLAQRLASLPRRMCRGGRTTNIPAGLRLALSMLERRPRAEKTIVLITDGQSNEEPDQLPVMVQAARATGVTVHCVAMGRGFDGAQLGRIAHPTGGKVLLVNDLRKLSDALTDVGRVVVDQAKGRPSALVMLIDYSGSMDEDAGGRTKLQRTSEACGHLLRWFVANHT